MQVYIFIDW